LFHVRDFWTSEAVELMTFEEVGVYVFLLSRQWETGSIPSDANALRTLCRRNATNLEAALRTVLRCFDDVGNGRLQNRRLEFERTRLEEKSGKASASAKARWEAFKAAGDPRKADSMRSQCERTADAMPTQCDRNASEGKGREGNTRDSTPLTPLARGECTAVDPASTASPKSKPKRAPDGGWQPVLDREDYAGLRAAEPFRLAWRAWIDHTRTAGSKAREPSGHSAAMILNRALREGPERFALAVESSIAGNWQGIHYPEARGFGSPHVSRADRNIAELFEQSRQIGGAS